jgi:hypothetical protein
MGFVENMIHKLFICLVIMWPSKGGHNKSNLYFKLNILY